MGIEEGSPSSQDQRAAFEEHIRNEIATTGGEPFKLLTDF
jgi:hypothetical protein